MFLLKYLDFNNHDNPMIVKMFSCVPPLQGYNMSIISLAILLFVQHLVQSDNKHHTKVQHYQPFNSQIGSPIDAPHQGPLMKKVFPYHNLNMCPTHWEVVLESWVCSDPSKRIQESFITLDCCQKVWFVQSPPIKTKKNTDLTYWSGNMVILMKFSLLAALKVVKLTTFSAARNENSIKICKFCFCVRLQGLIMLMISYIYICIISYLWHHIYMYYTILMISYICIIPLDLNIQ